MANHYHRGPSGITQQSEPEALLRVVQNFIERCRRPVFQESGDEPIPLIADCYRLEVISGTLSLDAWPNERSFHRRILSVEREKPGLLECSVQRFGGRTAKLTLLDLDHPRAPARLLKGQRRSFSEEFRRILTRQFPCWEVVTLSTEMSLSQSLSPVFPRAVLQRGTGQIAAIACPTIEQEAEFLSFALLWHHQVAHRSRKRPSTGLALFLPEKAGNITALRLKWLRSLHCRVYRFHSQGSAGELDLSDLGNLETRLTPRLQLETLPEPTLRFLDSLETDYHAECLQQANGQISLRCHGLEFARWESGRFYITLDTHQNIGQASEENVRGLAEVLSEIRQGQSRHRSHPLFRTQPERWLESSVRHRPEIIDASLEGRKIISQAITYAGMDRDSIDLLSATPQGRLVILELKTAEDIHLPLQALDYWMRIAWHAQTGQLRSFFPGTPLSSRLPKLLLVAPAVQFHATNSIILRYFSPEVETERVGVNLEWQQEMKIAFRLRGAESPISHAGVHYEHRYPAADS